MEQVERTVTFLDLTRFTSLTEVHGDRAAVTVVDRFTEAVRTSLPAGSRVVKTLGDGLLVESRAPDDALDLVTGAGRRLGASSDMPAFSGGITTGPVLLRGGDVFGSSVNLASRLAELAPADELRVTEPAARAAAARGLTVEPLGPLRIRGLHDPFDVFRVTLGRAGGGRVDPVCGMRISPGPTTPTLLRTDGTRVWFCSTRCADRFRADPDGYPAAPS